MKLFLGCFISLVATAFGFVVRATVLDDWRGDFNLSQEQIGVIQGAGLFPFAISIILFSLVVDKIGYGRAMIFAFIGHTLSAVITIFAKNFAMLYLGTLIFALANGVVEAVINPVVATVYHKNKTHWLNILHAGWPGGLVLGGLLSIGMSRYGEVFTSLPGDFSLWQWKVTLVLIPTLLYGILLLGEKFPVQERVAAGVSYMGMLREFGTASCLIVSFLLVRGIDQILTVLKTSVTKVLFLGGVVESLSASMPEFWAQALIHLAIAVIPTIFFLMYVKAFGRPLFVFLLLVMFLLATTELGTDSWIADIMASVLNNAQAGALVLVYTSVIMFILRFFAGPIVHKISPLGLLAGSAFVACLGLLWLSQAGTAAWMIFLAATCYGFGKTFFWPTTLGVVAEQFPRGGALTLNAIAGVGMISVGVLGNPFIGILQDQSIHQNLQEAHPEIHAQVMKETRSMLGATMTLDQDKRKELPEEAQQEINEVVTQSQQQTLAKIAILPAIMLVCYIILIVYFKSKGGYQAEVLVGHQADDEEFTGGVEGPVE